MPRIFRLFIALGVMLAGTVLVAYAALPETEFTWQQFADTYQYADVYLYKYSVDGAAAPGNELIHQLYYSVGSNSNTSASNVVITDTLPSGLEFVSWDGYGYVDGVYGQLSGMLIATVVGNRISWDLGTMNPGETSYINVTVRVSETAVPGTVLTNEATIATTTSDPSPGNNTDTVSETVVSPTVDLSVVKSLSSYPGAPGTQMVYRLEIQNSYSARVAAQSVVITDTLPAGVVFVSSTGSVCPNLTCVRMDEASTPTVVGSDVVWNIPDLEPGVTAYVYVRVLVSDALAVGDVVTNNTVIATIGQDTNLSNNHDTLATTLVDPIADLSVQKYPGYVVLDSEMTYTVWYRNEANLSIHNIVLTDTLPAEVTFLSSEGYVCRDYICTAKEPLPPTTVGGDLVWFLSDLNPEDTGYVTLRVQVSDTVEVGDVITNVAVISSDGVDTSPGNNTATLNSTFHEPVAEVRVVKSLNSYPAVPGGEMVYRLRFSNEHAAANADAQNVVLTDTLPAEAVFVSSSGFTKLNNVYTNLSEAETPIVTGRDVVWTLPALEEFVSGYIFVRVLVTDTVAIGDVITNNVVITTTTRDTDPSNNVDSLDTTIGGPIVDLDIDKLLYGGVSAGPGGEMDFAIRFTNDGNTTAHNVVLTDTLPVTLTMVSWTGSLSGQDLTATITPEIQGKQIIWRIGDLPALTSGYLYPRVVVSTTASAGDSLTNVAAVSTTDADVSPYDNEVSTVVTIAEPVGDLVLSKWASRVITAGMATTSIPAATVSITVDPAAVERSESYRLWSQLTPWSAQSRDLRPGYALDALPDNEEGASDPIDLASMRLYELLEAGGQLFQLDTVGAAISEVPVGSDLEYGISVHNGGYAELHNVVVTDTLPAGTTFVSWTGSGYSGLITPTVSGDTVVWEVGAIAAGSTVTLYPRVHVEGTVADGADLVNRVSCASSDSELSLLNNTASASVTAVVVEHRVFLPLVIRQ